MPELDELDEGGSLSQMREHIKNLEAQAKEGKQASAELEAERTRTAELSARLRLTEAKGAFRSAGFPESAAELFVQIDPEADPTPEAVAAFAERYNIGGGTAPPKPPAGDSLMRPTPGSAGSQAPSGRSMTRKEAERAISRGELTMAQALEMARRGEIEWHSSLTAHRLKGGETSQNPMADIF